MKGFWQPDEVTLAEDERAFENLSPTEKASIESMIRCQIEASARRGEIPPTSETK